MPKITPCLWFNFNAEEAIEFYRNIFPGLTVKQTARYQAGGPVPAGTLLTAIIDIDGNELMLLNGGPDFRFTEAVSFSIKADTQEDIDHYWSRLTADGGQESMCGWLKDKFGLSWQVVPPILVKFLGDKDAKKSARVMQAMMKMKKIEIPVLQQAYDAAG